MPADNMSGATNSPPRAPPIKYSAPLGTRWDKEKAAAGGARAFDLPTDPKSIGPWILGECVGKGASGRVKIAKHRRTGQLAAVKILPMAPLVNSRNSLNTQQGISDRHRLGVDREITMMKLMNHPNIMRIYDVFEGEKELFLVLEYVEGGELFDFLVNRGRLPPEEALEYFKQIIYGLNYAHTFSIIHRDLKPENILIASLSPPLIKIADWGMAAFAPPSLQLETSCGSPHYASPEIVNGEKYQGNGTDIWSCGVILYALLTGRLPFDDKSVRALLSKVRSGKYEIPPWVDPLARDLISRMLVVDVTRRITIPEILAHPWITTLTSASSQTQGKLLRPPTPPLPPSPSTLARPIASPDLIDPELFSSLRIIWGRYADPHGELIAMDLCSPAGLGVHTKAFYYLLSKYREESDRKRLYDGEGTGGFNGINRLRLDHGQAPRQSPVSGVSSSTSPGSRTVSSPIQAPGAVRRQLTAPSPMYRMSSTSVSRERPTLPIGPRPPPSPHRVHYHSDVHPAAHVPVRVSAVGPRPQPARRGHTISHPADKQIPFDVKPVDARIPSHTNEDKRRNTILSTGQVDRRRANVVDTRIPSPTFQLAPMPRRDCRQGVDGAKGSPSNVRSPRVSVPCQSQGKPFVNAVADISPDKKSHDATNTTPVPPARSTLMNATNVTDIAAQPILKTAGGGNAAASTHILGYKADLHKRSSHAPRIAGEVDKENRRSPSTPAPSGRRASGVGLGMGINNGRDISEEMGNVIYIGTGDTPVSKGKKERKSKPPALELPVRRSTITALGSPIVLSSPAASPHNTGSPARLLTSPVVGEFKGWFSNLFNWKIGGNSSNGVHNNGTLYSPDELLKTCGDVANLLESLGIIVSPDTLSENSNANDSLATARLRCRVEELSVDPLANISLKPVRFKVEFTPVQQPKPLMRQSLLSPPLSPITDNACFFLPPPNQDDGVIHSNATLQFPSAPNPGLTPRVRMSMLPVMMRAPSSAQSTPMPSPCLNELHAYSGVSPTASDANDAQVPCRSLCRILLVYEKGSTSSFKTIWKKVKEFYCDSPARSRALQTPEGLGAFSPFMASTPVTQTCPIGQSATAGC